MNQRDLRAVFRDDLESRDVIVQPLKSENGQTMIVVKKEGHGAIILTIGDWEILIGLVRAMHEAGHRK